eukprot:CAMPEP_0177264746 /NCGR_PEP_ID=MMETSP0367-20130122/61725_1 /TAXON_ID=447022 ORGANISM="Scrippsiella hangoei-like, Strain SHHI-4" /NCGR_SAMPLE_ID=MMETSP0367 /ASSEMBLY_ACC=CAM_ASM_000362 /LENGTH=93 /DNA_ID=CAMNT_0018719889 /DNA_START=138 /DNA_END=416 /DNA_ORIENTATION=+
MSHRAFCDVWWTETEAPDKELIGEAVKAAEAKTFKLRTENSQLDAPVNNQIKTRLIKVVYTSMGASQTRGRHFVAAPWMCSAFVEARFRKGYD